VFSSVWMRSRCPSIPLTGPDRAAVVPCTPIPLIPNSSDSSTACPAIAFRGCAKQRGHDRCLRVQWSMIFPTTRGICIMLL
jgi:hypothetical protein